MQLDNIIDNVDREIIRNLLADMMDGRFYTDMDDSTLQLSLMAMWENIGHWQDKGIPLGTA